jgi:hypothetical protein
LLGSLVKVKKTKNIDNNKMTEKHSETSLSNSPADKLQSHIASSIAKETDVRPDEGTSGSLGLLGNYGSSSDSD